MKCVNCGKNLISGVLWARFGATYQSSGIDPETYKRIPIERKKIERLFAFCDTTCQDTYFLGKERFNKFEVPLEKRLESREEVFSRWQKAMLETDDENLKDLLYVLRKGCN
jgi:hypothetical protein